MSDGSHKEIPEEVRKYLREIAKKGGRKIKFTDEKHKQNRERVQKHRRQKKNEKRGSSESSKPSR